MALTQGAKSKFPCPVCLVPGENLHDGVVYGSRTSESMQEAYNIADEMTTADERETYLQGFGLRYIQVS